MIVLGQEQFYTNGKERPMLMNGIAVCQPIYGWTLFIGL